MDRRIVVVNHLSLVLILALGSTLAGCRGGNDAAGGAASSDTAAAGGTAENPGEELTSAIAPRTEYVVEYDPNAVYTEEDLPVQGNFLKLNFTGMKPETVNKVIHRFKTENSPCESETCRGLLYEDALVTQAHCDVTLRAAKNVIREEKMKAGEWHADQ